MSSQICLKWNSFLNNIALSFESLWEEEGLVDVTLASDGQCLTAHKVILSASSPFFKKVFQTNPCQHPVIILQDVHFTELEALLIFIYKGEVNIEQKNLSALLKAAETLQIRGLSGGDIFPKESYKRLAELDQAVEDVLPPVEETPKKKQKTSKQQNNSILEKALTPQKSQPENASEPVNADLNVNKDNENPPSSDSLPNPAYQRLEMKLEPFEMTVEELQRQSPVEKEPVERLDTGQTNGTQGVSSKPFVTVIAEARDTSISASELQSENITNESDYDQKDTMEISDVKIEELTSESPNDSQTVFNPPYACDQEVANESTSTGSSGTSQSPAINGPNSQMELTDETAKSGAAYPPFPCPFCDRAYSSWGFRRRHIKAVHTTSPRLTCKWCFEVLPTHAAWRRHVVSAHNLSATDAHKGLLILEEAHMVLQIAHPTRLDTLVNIIKQSSQCQNPQDPSS